MTRTALRTRLHTLALLALVAIAMVSSSPVFACTVGSTGGTTGCGPG